MTDDLRDLIGRYSTGSLSPAEEKRLFDAALDDQDLFNELLGEHDVKQLLAEPGARARLIQALDPPKRTAPWFIAAAALTGLAAAVLIVTIIIKPTPKPAASQVAVTKVAPPAPTTPVAAPPPPPPTDEAPKPVASSPQPIVTPAPTEAPTATPVKAKAALEPAPEAKQLAETRRDDTRDRKELDDARSRVSKDQMAAPAPPSKTASAVGNTEALKKAEVARAAAPQSQAFQNAAGQNAPGGPRQQNQQVQVQVATASSDAAVIEAFGFHYSIETKGHLIVVPGADGFLTIKANDGTILYATKATAAGQTIDTPLPDAATSVTITFATGAQAILATPKPATVPSAQITGQPPLSIELKIK
jgi:hypothetical protein